MIFRPQKIFIERAAKDSVNVDGILSRVPDVPIEIIDETRSLIKKIRREPDPIGAGKRYLLLAHDKGRSFKPFPESEDYLSCDYYTLHLAEGCDLECSYCILQTYLTNPLLTVYVNLDEILAKLQDFLNQNPEKFFRIGTGQLADSLSLDPLTGYSEILVPFFAKQENAVLELKTKSVNIERLLKLDPQGKTIVSWSMNSEKIQREEEHKCAAIEERIQAAKRLCQINVIASEVLRQAQDGERSRTTKQSQTCHPEHRRCAGRSSGSPPPEHPAPSGRLGEGSKILRYAQNDKSQRLLRLRQRSLADSRNDGGSGYRVGFHLDPIIDYEGWEADYQKTLSEIFENIPQSNIAWISLGCLRFMPELKGIMQKRFPKSTLASAEWITGLDGKMRYEKARRIEIYKKMTGWIENLAPGVTIYLTMESPEVWHYVFGGEYSKQTVCELLDQAGKASATS